MGHEPSFPPSPTPVTGVGIICVAYSCCAQFCQLTRDGEVYHDYCLNYSKAMTYLEQLRKNDEFVEFEKVGPSLLKELADCTDADAE